MGRSFLVFFFYEGAVLLWGAKKGSFFITESEYHRILVGIMENCRLDVQEPSNECFKLPFKDPHEGTRLQEPAQILRNP